MKNQYNRPGISVTYWLVNINDLKKFYTFLKARHGSSNVTFELTTESGNDKEYESFQEFEHDIALLESNKEKVMTIKIGCSHEDLNGRGHIWTNINFDLQQNRFNIIGNDVTGEKKDWVDGSYEEMKRICTSFEIWDENMQIQLKKRFGQKYNNNVLVEDFNGSKKIEIEKELKKEVIPIISDHLSNNKNWWNKFISNSWVIGVGCAVIAGLILYWMIGAK